MAQENITITYRWQLTEVDGQFYVDEFCSLTPGFVRYGPAESRSQAADIAGLRKIQIAELDARIRRCKETHAQCGRYIEENVNVVFVQ